MQVAWISTEMMGRETSGLFEMYFEVRLTGFTCTLVLETEEL